MSKFIEYTSEELEAEYNQLAEALSLMSWDMKQQADELDYAVKNKVQQDLDEVEEELIKRGIFVE